jgi:hypothetical protein
MQYWPISENPVNNSGFIMIFLNIYTNFPESAFMYQTIESSIPNLYGVCRVYKNTKIRIIPITKKALGTTSNWSR